MSKLQPVRGTHDLLPDEMPAPSRTSSTPRATWRDSTAIARWRRRSSSSPRCSRARIGETSDVVTKEMYTFTDRGGEIAHPAAGKHRRHLRAPSCPTALTQQLPLKFFYCRADVPLRAAAEGPPAPVPPDRPRAARRRPSRCADIEVIAVGGRHPATGSASCDRCVLEINSLGDPESRAAYREVLVDYYSRPHRTSCPRTARDAAGAQSAAHPRQQGRGRQGDRRRRAVIRRPPEPGEPRLLRRGAGRPRRARHRRSRSIPRLVRGLDYYTPHRLRVRHRPTSARRAR